MHIVRLIERRFPNRKGSIISILVLLFASLLLLGLGLIFIR